MQLDEMLKRTIECIRGAVESDEIVGRPILAADGSVILPVSKLSYGFVSGGGEYGEAEQNRLPYAGASGGGVTVTPLGFLICGREKRFISLDQSTSDGNWSDLLRAALATLKKED